MDGKAADGMKRELPSGGIKKAADYLDRILAKISTYMAYIGSAALGFLVLMLMYAIVMRRLVNAPLKGSAEMTGLALVLITFLILAYDSFKGESMVVEVVVDRFPRGVRAIISVVMHFLTTGMLGVLCWQLFVQAMRLQDFKQTTQLLEIPLFPFLYLAAFAILILAVVYLKHFLYSVDKAMKK